MPIFRPANPQEGVHEIDIKCRCRLQTHVIEMTYYDGEPELYLAVIQDAPGFFRRVREAVCYIFGCPLMIEELVLNPEDATDLIRFLWGYADDRLERDDE